jgi:ribosomal protein L24
MAEWTMLLDMDDERYPSVGDWVTVRRGLYKGDVGYVWSVENLGQVTLLLVPRLPPPPMVGSSSGKRKRSGTRADPRLFTKEMRVGVAKNHDIIRIYEGIDGLWTMFGRKFQHGLEVRTFHRHSVSSTSVSMPSSTFYEFKKAPHPDIMNATLPCPSEWKFSEGERVVAIKPSEKRGIIKAVYPQSVEVDLEDGEGIVNVPWSNLRKHVAIGDFAEVISGALCGEKGWVVEISGDESVRISQWLERQEIRGGVTAIGRGGVHGGVRHNILTVGIRPNFHNQPLISLYQEHEVHINWVKVIDPPLTFTKQQSTQSTSGSTPVDPLITHPTRPLASNPSAVERAPWIKTEVIVCKVKHPMKGYRAIIKDVLPLQDTLSGLRITAQFTHINPAHPFKTEVLDYDDVVEVSYVTLISVGGYCD